MKTLIVMIAATSSLALLGCSTSSAGTGTSMLPSEAFCSDLKAGDSPIAIYNSLTDKPTAKEFADQAFGYAAISCPEQLKSNDALRVWLKNWQINPDA